MISAISFIGINTNLKLYRNIVRSYFGYRVGSIKPAFASYNLTFCCNLRCEFCDLWRLKHEELDEERALRVVDKICELGVPVLDFSGGEPMLRKDLFALAKRAKEYGCILSMNTNGTLFDEEKADKASKLFDYIVISLDGPKEVHDDLRGVKGSYDRALRALDLLKQRGVRVGINTVITPTNLRLLPSFIEEIRKRADFLTVQPINPCNRALNYDEVALEKLKALLLRLRMKGLAPLPIPYIEGIFSYLKCKAPKVCDAIRLYFAVSPMGDVLACGARNDIVLGDLFKRSLKDILGRPPLGAVEEVNRCSGCWLTCTSGISLAFKKPLREIKWYIRLRV